VPVTESDPQDAQPLAPVPPEAARLCFGAGVHQAVAYADLLAGPGVERGLIGPREVDRLWERHLLNCAVVGRVIPRSATICDLGSGAGLPGLALAIARPDLTVVLLEPLLRRTNFLQECISELRLERVTVVRGRAEEQAGRLAVDVVTARAVAPLERLARWALPLLRPGGELLAWKGSSAEDELDAAAVELQRLGAVESIVEQVGADLVQPAATVVRVRIGDRLTVRAADGRSDEAKPPSRPNRSGGRSGGRPKSRPGWR
jgi:16S rRNA (guanine527-N7)-methyltransferase